MSTLLKHSTDRRGVATVTFTRPETHNAFDDVLIRELTEVLESLGGDPQVRIVVLTGEGPSFSAGADLGWMRRQAQNDFDANLADAEALARLMRTLNFLPKPTIALVNGPAYGGGVGLVACCDIAVAAERASFCLSEVKLGLTPAVISPYVVAAIGSRQARRYFATAEKFSSRRALEIGLVHEVADWEGLPFALEKVLQDLLLGAPEAQAEAKDLIFAVDRPIIDDVITDTARRIALRRASDEGREGLGAFLERREPSWRKPLAS